MLKCQSKLVISIKRIRAICIDVVGPGGIGTGTRIGPSNFRLIGPVHPLDRRYSVRHRFKKTSNFFQCKMQEFGMLT
jgi:hypothetical protein